MDSGLAGCRAVLGQGFLGLGAGRSRDGAKHGEAASTTPSSSILNILIAFDGSG